MCNFLTNYFFFHSLSLSLLWLVLYGMVRCIYELWLMELTLTSICLREWKCSMQWFLPQKLNNKPSKWNGRGEKCEQIQQWRWRWRAMTATAAAAAMTTTTTIVECWMNVQPGWIHFHFYFTHINYHRLPNSVKMCYVDTRTDCVHVYTYIWLTLFLIITIHF